MRKIISFVVLAMLLVIVPAHAQSGVRLKATPHSVVLNWNSTLSGSTANVKRAICTGTITSGVCSVVGSFTTLGSVAAGVTTYTDLAVSQGLLLVYELTTVCVAPACGIDPATGGPYSGESGPSNQLAVTIPTPASVAPPVPTNLTLTSVQ